MQTCLSQRRRRFRSRSKSCLGLFTSPLSFRGRLQICPTASTIHPTTTSNARILRHFDPFAALTRKFSQGSSICCCLLFQPCTARPDQSLASFSSNQRRHYAKVLSKTIPNHRPSHSDCQLRVLSCSILVWTILTSSPFKPRAHDPLLIRAPVSARLRKKITTASRIAASLSPQSHLTPTEIPITRQRGNLDGYWLRASDVLVPESRQNLLSSPAQRLFQRAF